MERPATTRLCSNGWLSSWRGKVRAGAPAEMTRSPACWRARTRPTRLHPRRREHWPRRPGSGHTAGRLEAGRQATSIRGMGEGRFSDEVKTQANQERARKPLASSLESAALPWWWPVAAWKMRSVPQPKRFGRGGVGVPARRVREPRPRPALNLRWCRVRRCGRRPGGEGRFCERPAVKKIARAERVVRR